MWPLILIYSMNFCLTSQGVYMLYCEYGSGRLSPVSIQTQSLAFLAVFVYARNASDCV